MREETLSFGITNTTNGTIPVSLFGNNADAMDNANANTRYRWNVTGFTITNETNIALENRNVGVSNTSIARTTFSGTSLQNVINALNGLNLGVFFTDTETVSTSTYINNYNNTFAFGTLQILNTSQTASLSYSFNLNLSADVVNVYVNAVLIQTFTDPLLANGTIPVVAGDTVGVNFQTTSSTKGTNVFIYNITTGVYIKNENFTGGVDVLYNFVIVANNSYLIGMSD